MDTLVRTAVKNLLQDMHKLYEIMRHDYPDIPYLLLGHSMGSFLARAYSARYGEELSAVAFLGTCGPIQRSLLTGRRTFAEAKRRKFGPKAHDAAFARYSTGRFNRVFAPTAPNTTGSAATTALLTNTTTTRSAGSI